MRSEDAYTASWRQRRRRPPAPPPTMKTLLPPALSPETLGRPRRTTADAVCAANTQTTSPTITITSGQSNLT